MTAIAATFLGTRRSAPQTANIATLIAKTNGGTVVLVQARQSAA